MADEELVQILKEDSVEAWNQYVVERRERDSAWSAHLSRAHLPGTNLDYADLISADLSNAFLYGANLSNANLSNANLSNADLSNANLNRVNLVRADLSGANLTRANLISAHLTKCDLSGANLTGANLADGELTSSRLRSAHLNSANLSNVILDDVNLISASLMTANLTNADLNNANLTDANLTDASLSGANLTGANLSAANLTCTNFSGARLRVTVLGELDLQRTMGLDKIDHLGPSTVGIDTLYKSKGKIPDVFLRGCGMREDFIQYTRGLVGTAIDFYSCFISYSHVDKAFARRLHDGLQGRGIRCWLDEHELLPGDPVQDQIDRGIRLWDKVLVCCSEASLGFSAWVDIEVEKAMQKEAKLQKERGKRVHALIPLNLDNYLFDHWESGAASVLKGRLAADFRGWETDNDKFEQQFEKVARALQAGDTGREPPPATKL